MLCNGKYKEYWQKVQGTDLSDEFKDLIQKLFSYEGDQRPSLQDVINHPWMTDSSAPDDKKM